MEMTLGDSKIVEEKVQLESDSEAFLLFGSHDKNLRILRKIFDVKIVARNGMLKFEGETDQVKKVTDVVNNLIKIIRISGKLDEGDIDIAIENT